MIIFHDLNYFSQIHNINILSESFFLFGIAKKMFHEITAKTFKGSGSGCDRIKWFLAITSI